MAKSKGTAKAKLAWYHFCEHHLTDATGKNSYMGVFDTLGVTIFPGPGAPSLKDPLDRPIATKAFVLALHIHQEPDTVQQCEVRMLDADGQDFVPAMKGKLAKNPEGRNNLHIEFSRGIPVMKSGIYTFEVLVDGESAGKAELPVGINFEERGDSHGQ